MQNLTRVHVGDCIAELVKPPQNQLLSKTPGLVADSEETLLKVPSLAVGHQQAKGAPGGVAWISESTEELNDARVL